jgi:hypothetical protein
VTPKLKLQATDNDEENRPKKAQITGKSKKIGKIFSFFQKFG